MKYHPYSTYAASLGECERLAIKISRATGEEKLKLVRKRKNTCARSLARSLARTHARERPHTHTHTHTHKHTHTGEGGVQGGDKASVYGHSQVFEAKSD